MSLAHVKSVLVRFHPFHAANGTVRQFLAQINSPAYKKRFSDCETRCEVVHDRMVDPEVEVVFENKSRLVISCLGKTVNEVFVDIQSVMSQAQRKAMESVPESDEARSVAVWRVVFLTGPSAGEPLHCDGQAAGGEARGQAQEAARPGKGGQKVNTQRTSFNPCSWPPAPAAPCCTARSSR
jgi:hypothetical protein